MAILRIFLTETPIAAETDLAWELLDATGKLLQSGCDPLTKMPAAEQCQAVAPAAVVLLTTVKLPAGKAAQIRRLLPFVVEEQLAVETDSVHIALGAGLVEGLQPVAVVDKNWMQQSLAILNAAGLQVQQLFPETLLRPLPEEGWAVSWDGERGFVRTGEYAGLALEGTDTPFALQRLCQLTPPKQIQLYSDADVNVDAWSAQLNVPLVQSPFDAPRILSALDLLQGHFARQQFNWSWLPKLKPVLWLGAAMILLQLLGTGFVDWRLAREQQQLRSAMEADFRRAFPEATMVVDPVLQMERQLAALRRTAGIADAQDFLPLLNKITPLLTLDSGIQKIYYENKVLKLVLGMPTMAKLETLHSQASHLSCQSSWQAEGLTAQLKIWECL